MSITYAAYITAPRGGMGERSAQAAEWTLAAWREWSAMGVCVCQAGMVSVCWVVLLCYVCY